MVALVGMPGTRTTVAGLRGLFGIRALGDATALPRILDLFAQRGIIPNLVSCRVAGHHLLIDIEIDALAPGMAELLLHKLRQMPLVERAHLVEGSQ